MIETLSIIGVLSGIGIFCIALMNLGQSHRLIADRSAGIRAEWYVMTAMIMGFLVGYVFFAYHLVVSEFNAEIDGLIAGIFFFGALFTLFVSVIFRGSVGRMRRLLELEEAERERLIEEKEDLAGTAALAQAQSAEARAQLAEEANRRQALEGQRMELRMIANQRLEGVSLLAAGIAHDFNNLLVGILGNASYAKEIGPEEAEEYREALDDVETAAERAAELTRQLAAYSGKSVDVLETVDLNAMIPEIVVLMKSLFSSKVEVQKEFPPDLPLVWGDTSRFRQLIVNLIKNSAEAIVAEKGVIRLKTSLCSVTSATLEEAWESEGMAPGDYVALDVIDDGCGISESEKVKLFEPFYSEKGLGRGLGLAAVLGIVRSHGGGIRIDSVEGQGTEVRVFLPVAEDQEEIVDTRSLALGAASRKGSLLVVDDEPIVLDMIRRGLESSGYAVQLISTGSELKELLENDTPDFSAAILDVTMPDIAFDDVFNQVRSRFPTLPILVSSGYTDLDISGITAGDPNVIFMSKPYRAQKLLRLVSEMGVVPE
jgi:signal transduction histidine kinase